LEQYDLEHHTIEDKLKNVDETDIDFYMTANTYFSLLNIVVIYSDVQNMKKEDCLSKLYF
jgi:hypothetical protein